MYFNDSTIIYLNGEFVNAAGAKIDLYSQSLHYGYSVFEGIRAYKTIDGKTKIFKADEHFKRLKNSAQLTNIPYDFEDLIPVTYDLLEMNNIQDAYIRPLIYSPANMSFSRNKESYIMIAVWKMEPFLGEKLLRIFTSSFQRPNPKGFNIEAKASGHYVNSILASQEAKAKGYDEALLLDINNNVAEGPGANVFYEKDGKLITPALGNILPGITRATIMEICNELDIPVEEKRFTIDEIKQADTAFFCGTATEVVGWQSLDDIEFPKLWNDTLSRKIQKAYKNKVIKKEYKRSLTIA